MFAYIMPAIVFSCSQEQQLIFRSAAAVIAVAISKWRLSDRRGAHSQRTQYTKQLSRVRPVFEVKQMILISVGR